MKVACITMQRHESVLLRPWLVWHGALFGYEALTVLNHGSDAAMDRSLGRFRQYGVKVLKLRGTPGEFERKVELVSKRIALSKAEIVFPLDCDEFLALRTPEGFTVEADAVLAHLAELVDVKQTLLIPHQFANIPGRRDLYAPFQFQKVGFTRGNFRSVDFGFHHGVSTAAGYFKTRLTHLHFHFRPYQEFMANAARKLAHLDVSDPAALKAYSGRSMHLIPYLTMTVDEYYGQWRSHPVFHCSAFRARLRQLGAPLSLADDARSQESMPLGPVEFSAQAYLEANADVAKNGMDPLLHWYRHGFAEQRRLRPAPKVKAKVNGAGLPKLARELVAAAAEAHRKIAT